MYVVYRDRIEIEMEVEVEVEAEVVTDRERDKDKDIVVFVFFYLRQSKASKISFHSQANGRSGFVWMLGEFNFLCVCSHLEVIVGRD